MAFTPATTSAFTPYKFVVAGSGQAATDDKNFLAAIEACTTAGGGTIWIDGEVELLQKSYDMTGGAAGTGKSVSLCGFDRTTSRLVLPGGACRLEWGGTGDIYNTGTFVTMSAVTAPDNVFQAAGLTAAPNDYLLFKSDDTIPEVPWHSGTYEPKSAEIHTVMDIDGSYFINDFIFADPYVTSPQVANIPMIPNVRVANLTVVGTGVAQSAGYGMYFTQCAGARIEGVTFDNAPCPILAKYCVDFTQTGTITRNQLDWNGSTGYGSVFACTTNADVHDCKGYGCRHFVTTGSSHSETTIMRAGSTLKLRVNNCNLVNIGNSNGSMLMLDTHSESWGTVFSNNLIDSGNEGQTNQTGTHVNIAISSRGRNVQVMNNVIRGGPISRGINFYGPDGLAQNNTIENAWKGITVLKVTNASSLNEGTPNRLTTSGNTFRNLRGPGVSLLDGTDHQVVGDNFLLVGSASGTHAIEIDVPKAEVVNCNMHRMPDETRDSIEFNAQAATADAYQVRGNTMTGHGNTPGTSLGLSGTNAAALETELAPYNRTDP